MAGLRRPVRQPAIGATVDTPAYGEATVTAIQAHGERITVLDGNSRIRTVGRPGRGWLVMLPRD